MDVVSFPGKSQSASYPAKHGETVHNACTNIKNLCFKIEWEYVELHVKNKKNKKKSCNPSWGSLSICCSSATASPMGTSQKINCTIYIYIYI